MKKNIFTIFLFAFNFIFTADAQVVTSAFEAESNCLGLTIDGNYLYVSSAFDGKVHKIDITQNEAYQSYNTTQNNGLYSQNGICKYGEYILIARGSQNKIVKFNPNATNMIVEDVINVPTPNGIAIKNSELFISSTSNIYKVDLAEATPSLTLIASGIQGMSYWTTGTIGLKVYNNHLYVCEQSGISRINLTSGNYEKEFMTSYTGSSFVMGEDNDTFYLTSTSGNNQIYKLKLSTQTYSLLVSLDPFDYPNTYDIVYNNNFLFATCLESLKVAKIDLNTMNTENLYKNKPFISPNPSADYFILTGINPNENISIYNTTGQIIKSTTFTGERIDISDLQSGIYFLKCNGMINKFIKN